MTRPHSSLSLPLVAIVSAALGLVVGDRASSRRVAGGAPSFAEAVAAANPGVVQVAVLDPAPDPDEEPEGPEDLEPSRRGEGTGFLVDTQGHVLTNHHVVHGASRIRVTLPDRRQVPARLVGSDASTDVALLAIDPPTGVRPLRLGDSDALRVGDWVAAIGNPLSFEHSVTVGVVSSKGRKIWDASFDAYLQTDAAINPGNSGGPLIDSGGEVVGISSAMSREGQGIGFAIPINLAREVMAQLQAHGRVRRGYLGLQLGELDPDVRALLGLGERRGALVVDVVKDHSAERAGLRRYDVVTSAAGRPVADGDALVRLVAASAPGTRLDLGLLRDGRELSLTVEVGEREEAPKPAPSPGPSPSQPPPDALGLRVAALSKAERTRLEVPADRLGVVVEDLVSLAPGADELQDGDLVVEVDRRPTPDVEAYRQVLRQLPPGHMAVLLVYRPETAETFLSKLEVEGK